MGPLRVRVEPGVMAMKIYSTLSIASDLEPNQQMGKVLLYRDIFSPKGYYHITP